MKTYILYSEEGCDDCNRLKNTLNEKGIKYENRDINEEVPGLDPWRNRFSKNDLVAEHSLPGYVPILEISENNSKKIMASGMKFEERENVIVYENIDEIKDKL